MNRIPSVRRTLAAAAVCALAFGGFTAANAGCAFTVRSDESSVVPRTDVNITVECLHDAGGSLLAGKSVAVDVTRPTGGTSSFVVVTDLGGAATFLYTDTHAIGDYALSAASGLATATGTFNVEAKPAAGAFWLLPSDGCVLQSGTPSVTLNAFGIRDPSGDPAAPASIRYTIKAPSGGTVADILTPPETYTRTGTTSRPVPASDTDFTTASVTFDFMTNPAPPGVPVLHAPPGTYSVTAATQSASASTTFQVVTTMPSGTPATVTLTAPTGVVVPGAPAALSATVKDAAAVAIPCAEVTFAVTPPSGPATITTVRTNAAGVAALPYNRTDAYGTYSATATAGSVTSTAATFTTAAGDIAPSGDAPAYTPRAVPAPALINNAVTVLADNVISSTRRPVGGGTIELWSSKPDGVRIEHSATVAGATTRTGRATASAVLTAGQVDQAGDWLLQAFTGESPTGDPALDWNVDAVGLFMFTFESTQFEVVSSLPPPSLGTPVRDLSVLTNDADALGDAVTVTVGNLPAGTDQVDITVDVPGPGTYGKTTAPIGGVATFALGGMSETGVEGLYTVAATSKELGTTNGTGDGSFIVAIPRTLSVVANPGLLALPTESTTLTATFTETLTGNPIAGAPMNIRVENALGLEVHAEAGTTGAGGTFSTSAGLLETLLPGTYRVTATSGDYIAVTYFVVVLPLPPTPPPVPTATPSV